MIFCCDTHIAVVPCCPCIELYVAVYTYTSDEVGDLTFSEGDVINVVRTDGEWWTGSIGQRSGIFPGNFVRKYEERQVAAAAAVEEVEFASSCIVLWSHLPISIVDTQQGATHSLAVAAHTVQA